MKFIVGNWKANGTKTQAANLIKSISKVPTIKSTLKDHIRDYIFQKTKRNPMILPIIMSL